MNQNAKHIPERAANTVKQVRSLERNLLTVAITAMPRKKQKGAAK